ncbi:MAG: RNA polymerase sigma-54 factor, partial [Gammaproteobacteria bacterium]
MTPQLQQAIRLLQLSTLELQQEIQEQLESNPLLEMLEQGAGEDSASESAPREAPSADFDETPDFEPGAADAAATGAEDAIPGELSVDTSWEDIYEPVLPAGSAGEGEENRDFESYTASATTLADHLRWQLNLTPMSDTDRLIAEAIIDGIDADGMLTPELAEIVEGFDPALGIEEDEVIAVLHRLQHFDPPGVAARDLRECLLIQLRGLDDEDPVVRHARLIVDEHLELLAARDYTTLLRKLRVEEPELRSAIACIQALNPRPGSLIESTPPEYVVPDVLVSRRSNRLHVELNPEIAPRLRVNPYYAGLIRRADNSADNTFLRDNLQEARWFIKSLQSRNE